MVIAAMARTYASPRTDRRLCLVYQAVDNRGQEENMNYSNPTPGPDPLDTHDETRVAGLTGMSTDAAKTFLDFHTGMRWLHHRDDPDR
jgi:hypothetical protein